MPPATLDFVESEHCIVSLDCWTSLALVLPLSVINHRSATRVAPRERNRDVSTEKPNCDRCHIQLTALEVVGKQSRMVGHDLIAALQVLARDDDEIRGLCKQCGEGLGVAPIDSPCEVCKYSSNGFLFGFLLSI